MAHPAAAANPMQPFLRWCDALGITQKNNRQNVLINAVKAQSHETVLFFLCGLNYITNPTDLKGQGIEKLFIGEGTPFEINIGGPAVATYKQLYRPGAHSYADCTAGIL